MRLLYVTDRQIDAYLVKSLRQAGHVVETTRQPGDGAEMATTGAYDAIVLDWSTLSAACSARFAAAGAGALVLIIAEPGDERHRTAALDAGADACFARPASFMELDARLRALGGLVQRGRPNPGPAAVELQPAGRSLRVNGQTIALSPREYALAQHLVDHTGEVVGLERLRQQVWGDEAEPRPELVRTSILRLRRKLAIAQADGLLRAVKGHGYVLDPC